MADTAGNRRLITYDDTAELVHLVGSSPAASPKGFGDLRGWGAGSLTSYLPVLQHDTGIRLLSEDYAISAGFPPADSTLIAGGQDASAVTSHFTKLGWKARDGELATAPNPGLSGPRADAAFYSVEIPQVRASGSDVAAGGLGADLSQAGPVSGPTLAGDPLISALAACLGNVVAAQIAMSTPGAALSGKAPVAMAAGVLRPLSATATPQAVTCVAWAGATTATEYATDVRQALATGKSATTNEPFSSLLVHPSVTSLGGRQHIVRWQAQTPSQASLVLTMSEECGLPALPGCARQP